KGSRRALKESVSQIIVVGLEDIQNRMLQTDLGRISVVFDNSRSAFSGWAADRGRSSLTSWVGGPARQGSRRNRRSGGDDASRALSPSRPVHCRMQEPYCAPTRDHRDRL